MLNPATAQKKDSELLVGFPERIRQAYSRFANSGDLVSLDLVVLGVLNFYLAHKPAEPVDSLPGSTRLVEDLGCDSLTMMDTVFMVESLLEVKIDDAKLAQLATLDDLRAHVRGLIGSVGAGPVP